MSRIDKAQEASLRSMLYAQQGEPTVKAMRTLVESNLDRLKDEFVDCAPQELVDKQSEAKAWRRMLKYMTERQFSDPK